MYIREVNFNDLEGILELYKQLHNNTMPEKNERLSALWESILKDDHHHVLVAEEQDKIVSSCVCIIIPNLTHCQQPYALVENMVTDREHRGRGYATACLKYAREIAVQNRCYKMMLLTSAKSEKTLRFYENAGYNSEDKTGFVQWL